MRNERRKKKPRLAEPPEDCPDCGRKSKRLESGRCMSCRLRLNARAKAAAAPSPPPPAPEPPPEPVVIHAPGGCFRCGASISGMLCDFCNAELHGLPRREGDPIIKFPKPLTNCGY